MNTVTFVDGNSTIGLGHFYHSKELAYGFIKQGHKVTFMYLALAF